MILLQNAKELIQQGGKVVVKKIVRSKTTTERNRATLAAYLRTPRSDMKMSKLPTKKLIRLYKTVGLLMEKMMKYRLRTKLDRIIARKTGVSVRKRINIKLPFDSRILKRGVRETAEDLVGTIIQDKPMVDFVKTRIRVLWLRNCKVAKLIHNQKKYANEEEHPWSCKGRELPKHAGHILTRFSELEIPDFLRNSRNVTKSGKASDIRIISRAIVDAVKHLRSKKEPKMEPDRIYSRQQARRTTWIDEEVRIWRKQFNGLVLSPIDMNQGDTAVICPIVYRHGFGKTFAWNSNYEQVGTLDTEEKILKRSKEDFLKSGLMSIGK
ncbi:hypothetical protein CBR_g21895 [Chara braunii]|uniref:Uncharacterized protein n=1 Tax=Chara braunii TaxID=69332 RepID=A0A388L1H1_CHABU|nr:hypothetical protein CBR_g21895 [Chara braunii]|eukprot:GBG76147.1 hypothetical protein CBR_g21895 [Chara braunii]